ncbi:hypothetical protein M2459_002982 [Parabacteroides sp. PF5-5]|uniref:DUF4252 domain-containing protein n=1 Tax=unclassified Parabacteroides TaxID=2649774 RepID=UPI0024744252|nr:MULTISPECIES: DUF4252 domain-containing protein [unclassified Parabacteroides]MDH6305971.1 hypothetical protein [Parabacteroides sp. PH5-39]MDH6317227.1 hypothetical protein [Parabacteroides sp. PF5-13]MDH6320683.1 hypothetical protein [Parabacteroides sp. PH5-13]MDH6324396.1 hypothetical protein [Parabacteroides sp. PH5-8]MDH6328412.1 hypothetical protein [Parabacteroides sp. PH5-41]
MKTKYIITAVCLFCATLGFAQDKLFDKYADMDNVTSVYISKAMFQMMPTIENVGLNLMNMKGKIESLQLVSTERTDQIPQMKKEFKQLVNSQHQELMRVKDGKTRATFYATMKGDKVKDLFMLADTDSSFTVIQLLGNFTLQDIQEITKEMEK